MRGWGCARYIFHVNIAKIIESVMVKRHTSVNETVRAVGGGWGVRMGFIGKRFFCGYDRRRYRVKKRWRSVFWRTGTSGSEPRRGGGEGKKMLVDGLEKCGRDARGGGSAKKSSCISS